MKKYFLILLLAFPCIGFAQSKNDVESAIDKINIELVRGYVHNTKNFPKDVNDWKTLYTYIKRMYPDKNHMVHKTFLNLNYAKRKYIDGEDPSKFINGLLNEYVEYDYDRKSIDQIISSIEAKEDINKGSASIVDISAVERINKDEIKNKIYSKNTLEEKIDVSTSQKLNLAENENNGFPFIAVGFLLGSLIGYFLRPLIEKNILSKVDKISHLKNHANFNINNKATNPIKEKSIEDNETKQVIYNSTTNKKEEKTDIVPQINTKTSWIIAHTSQPGKSHITSDPPVPCQDNHAVRNIEAGWGIAISCDGAGSASLSHKGSKFIANEAINLFEEIVKKNKWIEHRNLPKQEEWEILARKAFKKLRYDLEQFAKRNEINPKDLACTVIVIIYSPIGLLTTHIGDGRAGYRNQKNHWEPIISPHKGEEANHTIFITSNPWLEDNFTMSGKKVPESNVINDKPSAFTLMSDGCEMHSFEMGYFDTEKQKFIEQNNPYPNFFEPLIKTLLNMKEEGLTMDEINQKWSEFVRAGTEKLKNEPDDKTLILGVITD